MSKPQYTQEDEQTESRLPGTIAYQSEDEFSFNDQEFRKEDIVDNTEIVKKATNYSKHIWFNIWKNT